MFNWLRRKKSGAGKRVKKGERQAEVLEIAEERVEKEEIKLVEEATRLFMAAAGKTYYDTSHEHEKKMVALNRDVDLKELLALLGQAETNLANVRNYTARVAKLAGRLEADLLDIRDSTKDRRMEALSEDEMRVINYNRNINHHIRTLVGRIRVLKNKDFEQIRNKGYFHPKNPELAKEIRRLMRSIHEGLSTLHKHLTELFTLEEAVRELTAEFVKSS